MTGALRRIPALRGAVIVDLGLWFVLPTQLVVTMVVDRDAFEVVTYAVSAGSVGVIVGRLLLLRVGVGDRVARRLTVQMVVWVGLLTLGWFALIDRWVLGQPLVIGAIVGVGSIVIGYSQGLTAALVQQRSPDDIRGRVTGLVSALRFVFTALGVVVLTAVVQPGDSQRGLVMLMVLGLAMIAVTVRTRSLNAA